MRVRTSQDIGARTSRDNGGRTNRDIGGRTSQDTGTKHPRDERQQATNQSFGQDSSRLDLNASQGLDVDTAEDERQTSFFEVQRMEEIGRSFDHQEPQGQSDEDFVPDIGDQYEDVPRSAEHETRSENVGAQVAKSKKQKGTAPRMEETMMAYVDMKKQQANMKEQASKQFSITSCLEVLIAMDDVFDEVKVLTGDVFKNVENRELFIGYGSRLRGLWLKKEVAKLGTQLPPSSPISAPTKQTHKDPNIQRLIDDCPSFDLGL